MATIFPVSVVAFFSVLIVASIPGYASECTISNVEILSDLIDKRINATVTARVAELTAAIAKDRLNATVNETIAETVSTAVSKLNLSATVDERTGKVNTTVSALSVTLPKVINHPVIEMLYIALTENPRTVSLKSINTARQEVGDTISTLTISNPSIEYTSSNNVLAYRPNHSNHSGGNTAIVFVNLEAAIPCYQANPIGPVCHLFTLNKEGFQYGKPFIQASDIGSKFRVFSQQNNTATYGFGVTGCTTFHPTCVSGFEVSLVCLLPPALEQCG